MLSWWRWRFSSRRRAAESARRKQPILPKTGAATVRCEGGLGLYRIEVAPSKTKAGFFELIITPLRVQTNPNEQVDIVLTNRNLTFATLVTREALKRGVPFKTVLSRDQLIRFDILALSLSDDRGFLQRDNPRDTLCTLPMPSAPAEPRPHATGATKKSSH